MSNSIARNTAYMTVASIGQKIISFFYFSLIARMLGAEETGKYFFALSFTTLFAVLVDLGLTNVLVRESAKNEHKIQDYVSTVLAVKVLFGLIAYVLVIVVANILGYESELKHLIYLSGITMFFDSIHATLYGVLRAIGTLRYEATSITVSQALTLILGSIFLWFKLPVIFLIVAFVIPSFLNVCFAGTVLYRVHRIRPWPLYHAQIFRTFFRIAIPFGLAAIFARVYSYIDSILLQKLVGNIAVGWYSIPYKMTYAFQFIPLALTAALYPRLSEYFIHDKKKLVDMWQQGMKYLLLIAFPIAIGVSALAPGIILKLYTHEYEPAILPLQILIFSLIFSYASFPIGALLNACNRQGTQTAIVGGVMVLNILLNLALIPRLSVVGAAIAALIGNICLTVGGYLVVPRITTISHRYFLELFLRLFVCAGIMGLVVYWLREYTNVIVVALAGAVVYAALLLWTQTVTAREIREMKSIFRGKRSVETESQA